MNFKNKKCVIVDAYSTGNQLAKHFRNYGYSVIHVQSSTLIPEILASSFRKQDFDENLVHFGDVKETAEKLSKFHPTFVIPGSETGVELADAISFHLDLIRNKHELSRARRDKYLMIEAVKKFGLKTVDHIKSSDCEEIISWATNQNKWPIVIKPINSAASDGVTFCNSKEEIRTAFYSIYNQTNCLGLENKVVLAQTFLEGKQYIVNAVSRNGQHFISDIWFEGFKQVPGKSVIYDQWTMLPSAGKIQEQLISYVTNVLTALGIDHGPSHTEVMLTKDGPVLVETGARTMGLAFNEAYMESALGYSQSFLTAECYAAPEKFLKRIGTSYELKTHLMVVFLISSQEGTILNLDGLELLKGLESFSHAKIMYKPGDQLTLTKDPSGHPGFIFLRSDDPSLLEQDYNRIRKWESQQKIFTIASTMPVYNQK
jgi:biotin carboxylase